MIEGIHMLDNVVISISRTKTALASIGALIFVGLGLAVLMTPHDSQSAPFHGQYLLGFLGILFFGACFLIGFRKFFGQQPGLTIDVQGIIDHSSGVAVGFVPWSEVSFIRMSNFMISRFILVGVSHPEQLINSQSILKRFSLRLNYKMFNTPVCINTILLQLSPYLLEETLIRKWNQYKGVPMNQVDVQNMISQVDRNCQLIDTGWICVATFIGGPLAGFILLAFNFNGLNQPIMVRKVVVRGVIFSLLLFTMLVIVPQKEISTVTRGLYPIFIAMAVWVYADAKQGKEIKAHCQNGGRKYSGWVAVGIGLASLMVCLLYVYVIGYFLTANVPGFIETHGK
jgi:hypothetical protein